MHITLKHTTSHTEVESSSQNLKSLATILTLSDFEEALTDHHHRRLVIFCLTQTCDREPSPKEKLWFQQYGRLNNIHFVCAHLEKAEEALEDRLQLKVKPCWVTFHKGEVTGWSEGGIKRFVGLHEKKKSGN
jgi:hypothetical protein